MHIRFAIRWGRGGGGVGCSRQAHGSGNNGGGQHSCKGDRGGEGLEDLWCTRRGSGDSSAVAGQQVAT
jgi:hypothetical protein